MKYILSSLLVSMMVGCGGGALDDPNNIRETWTTNIDQGVEDYRVPSDVVVYEQGVEEYRDQSNVVAYDQGVEPYLAQGNAGDSEQPRPEPTYASAFECPNKNLTEGPEYVFRQLSFNDSLDVVCKYEVISDGGTVAPYYYYYISGIKDVSLYYGPSCYSEGMILRCLRNEDVQVHCEGAASRPCTVPNGKNDSGLQRRTCTDGQWGPPYGTCRIENTSDDCEEGYVPAVDYGSCCLYSESTGGEEPCTVENGKENSGRWPLECLNGEWKRQPYEHCVVDSQDDCMDGYKPSVDGRSCVEIPGTGALYISSDGSLRLVEGQGAIFPEDTSELADFVDEEQAAKMGISLIGYGVSNAMHPQSTVAAVVELSFLYNDDYFTMHFDPVNDAVWAYVNADWSGRLGGNRLFGYGNIGNAFANTTELFTALLDHWPIFGR